MTIHDVNNSSIIQVCGASSCPDNYSPIHQPPKQEVIKHATNVSLIFTNRNKTSFI